MPHDAQNTLIAKPIAKRRKTVAPAFHSSFANKPCLL